MFLSTLKSVYFSYFNLLELLMFSSLQPSYGKRKVEVFLPIWFWFQTLTFLLDFFGCCKNAWIERRHVQLACNWGWFVSRMAMNVAWQNLKVVFFVTRLQVVLHWLKMLHFLVTCSPFWIWWKLNVVTVH